MKKSFKILIFLMAFAFMGVVNVKAEEVTCSGFKWISGEWSSYSEGTESTNSKPTCSYTGTSWTEVQTVSPGNSTCPSAYIASGCHRSRTWTRQNTLIYPFSGATGNVTVKVGSTATVSVNKKSECTGNVTYSSSDTSVATVSGSTVRGVKAGTATITASYSGDSVCMAAQDTIGVTVNAATPVTKTDPTITGASNKSATGTGTISLSLNANVSGSFSCTATSNYLTVASNCSSVTVSSMPVNNVPVPINYTFTPSNTTNYNVVRGSFNINLQGAGNANAVDSVNAAHSIVAVTPADGTVPNSFTAQDASGKPTQVKWTVSGEGITYNCADNTTTCTVNFSNMGTNCSPLTREVTVTATDGSGNTKSTKVTVYSYRNWAEYDKTGTIPTGAHNPTGMKYQTGCEAYDKTDKGGTYTKYYNRCCGGPTGETPKCYKCNGNYEWGLPSEHTSCTEVTTITDQSKCKNPPTDTPACYKCGEVLKWGKYASDNSCTFVSENESDCEEKPYCYKNVSTGEYDWGKHAGDKAWVKYSENEADCQKEPEEETPACYTKSDEYYWGKYKDVPGYTFTSLTEAQCKKFCYKEKATGLYEWGNRVGDDKYEIVAEITDKNKCKAACYKCDDEVKWGPYGDDNNCEEVPGVTSIDECKVTPPPTGLSVSNILYACGAFLVIMGSGIVVYQLTRVKKELE